MSRYKALYHDRIKGLAAGGCVTIQSLYRDRRAVWLASVSRYNRLYRDMRRLGSYVVIQCCDTASHRLQHAHGLGAGCVVIQLATRQARLATQPGSTTTWQGMACDTAPCAPRYSPLRATTQRSARTAWAQCAQPGSTMRAARVRWVCTCTPNPVLESVHCFSQCLDHCS